MGVIRDNRTKIVAGGLISASYVSDVYNVLTGNTVENVAFSGSVNITGSLIADLTGTASFANTASYSIVTTNVVTSSSFADTASFALNVTAPQYLYIDPASGSVTVDFASASMIELNVTDDLTLTLTGSETARDYKLLLRNASTVSKTLTWTNTDIYYNSTTLSSTVSAANSYIEDSTWPLFNPLSNLIINNSVTIFEKLSSGKYIAFGNFTSISGSSLNRIARLNSDYSIDNTFDVGTGFNNTPYRFVEQSDGKLVVIGQFTQYSGSACNYITRINTDGTQDTGFNIGSGFNQSFSAQYALQLQSDGKLLVGGSFTAYSGSSSNRIARINTDGTLDTGFNIGTGFNNYVMDIKLQSDEKIIVISSLFTQFNGTSVENIVRLNTDGTLDTVFDTGTISGTNGNLQTLYVQSNDKIVVYSENTNSVSGSSVTPIFRLNSNGSLDNTFINTDTSNWIAFVYKIRKIVENNNKLYVTGNQFGSTWVRILDNSGSLLSSITGNIASTDAYSLFVSGSNIYVGGSWFNSGVGGNSYYIIKLDENTNPLKYNNYNIYSNGSRYFVDLSGYQYIYETDPNIP
jgi:uncharacterized delta-60 repeat protein